MVHSNNNLPESAKVWVFQSDRELSEEEVKLIESKCQSFLQEWNTHGTALVASAEVFYQRFLVFFVDELQVKASGCSIDKMTALVKAFENKLGNSFFNRLLVAYEDNESNIKTCPLSAFEDNCNNGTLNETTTVFNNLITNKKEFANSWKTSIKNSWHSRYLKPVNS